jgi:hypothetical protein
MLADRPGLVADSHVPGPVRADPLSPGVRT